MTREEAIEILRKNRPTSDPRPCGMELCDAVDMAISALRQQEQSGKNLLRSVQVIKYTCGAGTPEEAETNCTYFIRGECTASFCEYRMKKQTNADRIRDMTDEELAEFLADAAADYCHVGLCKDGETCRICCLRWLQMTEEEADHVV